MGTNSFHHTLAFLVSRGHFRLPRPRPTPSQFLKPQDTQTQTHHVYYYDSSGQGNCYPSLATIGSQGIAVLDSSSSQYSGACSTMRTAASGYFFGGERTSAFLYLVREEMGLLGACLPFLGLYFCRNSSPLPNSHLLSSSSCSP
jgi:hypothetical protein